MREETASFFKADIASIWPSMQLELNSAGHTSWIDLHVVGSVVFSSVDVAAVEEETKINLLMFIKAPFWCWKFKIHVEIF